MIDPEELIKSLIERGVNLFTGVPDSLLINFISSLTHLSRNGQNHLIAANEGNAIGLAIGNFLSTGKPAVVYMQNSGLGNAINPITSLADPDVFGIPMILMIGWRGEPGFPDEPQHLKQGKITEGQLMLMGIPYLILDPGSNINEIVEQLFELLSKRDGPVALLVRSGAFRKLEILNYVESVREKKFQSNFSRENAIKEIINAIPENDILVVTTGKAGRELFDLRARQSHKQNAFLTVGGMGHCSSIALGVALAQPDRRVICIDGDGSMLMHLGALAIIGDLSPKNLIHVVLNNSSHESVGGQPTVAGKMNLQKLARACNYKKYYVIRNENEIPKLFNMNNNQVGPIFCEVIISNGSRSDLGRPTESPVENKISFMGHVREGTIDVGPL